MKQILEYLKVNSSITLALGTAYIYYLAYQVETGYCTYYNIPFEMIQIDVTALLIFASMITGIAAIISYIPVLLNRLVTSRVIMFLKLILIIILAIAFFISYFSTDDYPFLRDVFFTSMAFASLLLLGLIIMVRRYPKLHSRLNVKINNSENQEESTLRPQRSEKALALRRNMAIMICFGILYLVIPAIFTSIGKGKAGKQKDFYLLKDYPEMLFIKQYGEKIIGRSYDKRFNLITDNIIIINSSRKEEVRLLKTNIKPKNVKTLELIDHNKYKRTVNKIVKIKIIRHIIRKIHPPQGNDSLTK